MEEPLLFVKGLKKYFPIKGGIFSRIIGNIYAVDGVDLSINKGETMGLVGESGCGKTTVGRCILNLIEPTSGEIYFKGKNILKLDQRELLKIRREMQIVFQDPYASLNPRMSVKQIVGEPLIIHDVVKGTSLQEKILDLLLTVGLTKDHLNRFPHEFSGGQRQRIGIAKALALNPNFLVLDEPTSSLDVSVQAKILNLLKDLQQKLDLTFLFISHDLNVIKHMSDRISTMYSGMIVETGNKKELFSNPLHPYTQALFSAIPIPDPEIEVKRLILAGEVPDPSNPPSGCRFYPRCPIKSSICDKERPILIKAREDHYVACHKYST